MRAERKLATVLFADLTGSTELGASQDPERTRAMLERFYDAMKDEIVSAGGTIEKFAGDAVMAAFGVPVAQEDHVERGLHAALAMRRRLEELFGGELTLRVGVNCGEVVVGDAHEGSSFVTGDAVNVAARLEQIADPGDILVGERAAAIVSGAFEFEALKTLPAKGKPAGIACRKLVRELSLMRPRGVPGLRSAFVGRDSELAAITGAYERCSSRGEPQLVTVMGEAGVGKTRLVRELWHWLGQNAPGSLRRTGRCPPYGHAVTYQPLAEILKEHFGLLDSDAPERTLTLLGDREILALALGLDVAGELHPIVARDHLHDAWVELAQELAAERPLVVLAEDLHWAEEPLVELLERTLLEVQGPLLLVGTARPEFLDRSPTWGRGRAAPSEWIWLEPLAPDDVHRLLDQAVGADVSPAVHEFLARAEGNPLFLEELIATLRERGALRPGERWDPELLETDAGVPESVQSVLAARIDLLPPTEKRALQAAAVIGRVFWPGAVRKLLDGVDADLRLLEQRDFVRRRTGSSLEDEREFAFKHAITREVAYGSLTIRDRARLHAAFASWLDERGGRDEDAALLALHYGDAVRPENADLAWSDDPEQLRKLRAKALRWLRRAAELAGRRCEVEEALALLEPALALAEDDRSKIEIHRELAYTHTIRYDSQSMRSALESALALGPEPAVAAEIYGQLAFYGLARPYMWVQPPSRELGEEWLAQALELSSPGSEARAYALLARGFSQPGAGPEAEQAYAIGEALGKPRLVVLACEAQMLAATELGRYAEAREWADRALEAASALDDPGLRALQYWSASFAYLRAGLIENARPLAAEADRLTSSLTEHDRVHGVWALVLLESVSGNWQAFGKLSERAEAATAANQAFPCQFNWRNLLVCALGLARAGKEEEADRLKTKGCEGALVVGPPEREPALLRLALFRGDLDEARRILEALPSAGDPFGVDSAAARLDALLALGEGSGVEEEAAPHLEQASYTRPFALRALGAIRGDASLIDEAASQFEGMGLGWRAAETRALVRR